MHFSVNRLTSCDVDLLITARCSLLVSIFQLILDLVTLVFILPLILDLVSVSSFNSRITDDFGRP